MMKSNVPTSLSFEASAFVSPEKICQNIRQIAFDHWENTLRAWFLYHLGGIPSDDDLRTHGRWIIPQPSPEHISMQQDFAWRGQRILTGYLDLTTGTHHIHDVSSPTP